MFLRVIFIGLWACLGVPLHAGSGGCDAVAGHARDMCISRAATSAAGCAAVGDGMLRLACWDRLYQSPGEEPLVRPDAATVLGLQWASSRSSADPSQDEPATAGGRWAVERETSPFSNTTDVFLSLSSTGITRCGAQAPATLYLRCMDDRTSIHIAHGCVTPRRSGESWTVDLSMDGGAVTQDRMQTTDNSDGFGHFTYREARELIERLARTERLDLQFADLNGVQSRLSFPVAGLSQHLPALAKACHWSEVPPWAKDDTQGAAAVSP
ncbi:MAG: type VI secretion system-associated protein TagO [Pseudomonadota bacterium]